MVIYEGLRYRQNPGRRYTVCRVCKQVWNTDKYLVVPAEKYVCPHCVHSRRIKYEEQNHKDED